MAFVGGLAARAVRLSPVFGYLLAGIVLGPFTPGYVIDQKITNELAEIGVALLLFGVGLHFSFDDLLAVRRSAVPGAIIQITIASAFGYLVATYLIDLPPSAGWVVGLSLAIASTAVATRALEERGQLAAAPGRIALGWLVAQDIVVILALTLVPVLAPGRGFEPFDLVLELARALLQIAGFVAIIVLVGRRAIPWLLGYVARAGSRELFTLAVFVVALGIAYGSAILFGISLALAAFFAGVALGESDLSHHVAAEALPMQQVFAVLFFVSVGMLFDPMTLVRMPVEIAALLLAIVIGTGLTTILILLFLRAAPETAALVGASFAQIGEFSFILTDQAVRRGLMDAGGRDLVLAVALIAIVINPLMFPLARRFAQAVAGWKFFVRLRKRRGGIAVRGTMFISDHAILVGHGRVGRTVSSALRPRPELCRGRVRPQARGEAPVRRDPGGLRRRHPRRGSRRGAAPVGAADRRRAARRVPGAAGDFARPQAQSRNRDGRAHPFGGGGALSCRVGGGTGGHGRTRDCGGHVRLRPAAPRRRCPHGPQHRRPPARKQRSRRGC